MVTSKLKKIIVVFCLLCVHLAVPLSVKAKVKTITYDDVKISFKLDQNVWKEHNFKENSGKVWTSNCGMITIDKKDVYSQLTKEEKGELNRSEYNYRNLYSSKNDAEDIAKRMAEGYKEKLELENINWEIKDFGIKFINLKGISTADGNRVDFEQYITTNNGYIIALEEMTAPGNKDCGQDLEDIAKTAVVTDYAESTFNPLNILVSVILTFIAYMIYPFTRIIIMKHEYTEKEVKNMVLWNSIIVGGLFLIFTTALYGAWSAAPALLYYCINSAIWVPRFKNSNDRNNITTKQNSNNVSKQSIKLIKTKKIKSIKTAYKIMIDQLNKYIDLNDYITKCGVTIPIDFNKVLETLEKINNNLYSISPFFEDCNNYDKSDINKLKNNYDSFCELLKLDIKVNEKLKQKSEGKIFKYKYLEYRRDTKKINKLRNNLVNQLIIEDSPVLDSKNNIDNEREEHSNNFVCSNCGNKVSKDARKCPKCGEFFEKEDINIDAKVDSLNKLKKLLDDKVITKEEFKKEKEKILNQD